MKNIVFGITNLNIGGAEKVLVDLSNKLSDKHNITIFTLYNNGSLEKYLNKNIKLISLYNSKYEDLSFIKRKLISLLFTLKPLLKLIYKKYIKNKYDVEISFLEGPITSLFAHESNSKKIAWIHTNLSKKISRIRKTQYENDYNKYDKIIFVSKDSLDGFNSIIKNNKEKLVIENYMDINDIVDKANEYKAKEITKDVYSFVTVCRVVKAKALDRLAKVSKKLIENGYKHKIYVVGDGEEYNNLKNLINELDIKDTFILVGMKDNPYPYINASDSFVLASLYEGYGMVLIEAMALNKDILITDTGSKEALKDYNKKLIVDNSFDGIYNGMKDMISNKVKFKENNNKIDMNKTIEKVINLIEGDL